MAHRVRSLRLQDTHLQFTATLLRIILHEPPLPLRERISSTRQRQLQLPIIPIQTATRLAQKPVQISRQNLAT